MLRFFQSVKNAWRGICFLGRTEKNFKIHLFLLGCAFGIGLWLQISLADWLLVFLFSAMVLALEAMNTAIEASCDLISKEHNQSIKRIKDMAAGAVLIASVFALIGGAFIFGKYLFG